MNIESTHRMTMRRQTLVAAIFLFAAVSWLVAQSAHSADPQVITNSIDMKLVHIPTGTFTMGSTRSEAERVDTEERHEVTITKSFYMGVYEVKQSEYMAVGQTENKSRFKGDDNPVENVEWKLAKIFCDRLSARPQEKKAARTYRLPTEAEWEYACRAGTSTAFNLGESLASSQANFNGKYPAGGAKPDEYLRRSTKVGSYKPNAFGLYDMHGNVAEWCSDWYAPDYYLDSPDNDPLGPPVGVVSTKFDNFGKQNYFVVVRGGCWVDDGRGCRSAYRFRAMPNTQYRLIGFRVVCEVTK
ncbi:MAG: sulfatase modifying factor 1 [Pirellulaceae bacterium]|jgi:sulfatase modifying factor 1